MAETTGPSITSTWRRFVLWPRVGFAVGLLCLLAASFYYKSLLGCCSSDFFAPVPYGLTFNSMLLHLLQGRFDVDPQTIGDEGSLRNGLVYTYFGVLPALLRLPFLRSADFAADRSCDFGAPTIRRSNIPQDVPEPRERGRRCDVDCTWSYRRSPGRRSDGRI